MNMEDLSNTTNPDDTQNQPSTTDRMSIIDIKQRRYSQFKELKGDFKEDEFDYKQHEEEEKAKMFLLLLPFRIIVYLFAAVVLFFIITFILYSIGIMRLN